MISISNEYSMNFHLVLEFLERWTVVRNLAVRVIDPQFASCGLGFEENQNASDYYRVMECFFSETLDRFSHYYNPQRLVAPMIIMRESEGGVESCFEVKGGKFHCYPNGYPQHEQDFPVAWEFDASDEAAVMEALKKMGFSAHDIAAAEAEIDQRRTYEEEQQHNYGNLSGVKRQELDDFIEREPVMKWLISRVSATKGERLVSLWHPVEIWHGDDQGDDVSVYLGFLPMTADEGTWCIVPARIRSQFRGTDYSGEAQYLHLGKNLDLKEILKILKPYVELNAHDTAEAYSLFGCGSKGE